MRVIALFDTTLLTFSAHVLYNGGMRKVLVISTINGIAGRSGLMGMFNYVNDGHDWSIRFKQDPGDMNPAALEAISKDGLDGIIVSPRAMTPQIERLLNLSVPVVMIHCPDGVMPKHGPRFALLKNDDRAVGRTAAEHFLSKSKFRSYAFIPTPLPTNWSDERLAGFAEVLKAKGAVPAVWRADGAELADFLRALPKPAAVLGATDLEAINVLTACRKLKINVPSRVAVLGVDDDEMMCEATKPTLSSVRTDDVELGRRAAAVLSSLMSSRRAKPPSDPILVPPSGVTERNSTRAVPPSGYLIQESLSFARRHFAEGIGVDDVVRHLGVSRSLASLRFREYQGETIREAILRMRLEELKKRLSSSHLSVSKIARVCGFTDIPHLQVVFKKKFGLPMGMWRRQFAAT